MKIDFCTPTASDRSIKYRFRTDDGEFVEALFFLYNQGLRVLCLSTQIGCDMGCKFCATGLMGRKRNLTKEEIIAQAELILADNFPGKAPDTITLAGMGEPLANYDASLGALEEFRKLYGDVRLSLSTVGLPQQINRMIQEKRSFGLYLSLHALDPKVRNSLMPIAKHPIEKLISLIKKYALINKPGLVQISYLLLNNITDSEDQLNMLVRLLGDHDAKDIIVQLRIWNKVDGLNYSSSSDEMFIHWIETLNHHGIQACICPSAGQEIDGGCGQLANHPLLQKIIPLYFFQDALEYMHDVDQNSLILFDVDSVLTLPANPVLHPYYFKKYKEHVDSFYQSITREQKHFLNHQIIAHPVELIEKNVVDIIGRFQMQKTPTIAFTNAKRGKFSKEECNFCNIRFNQLKSLGIDFSVNASPDEKYLNLNPTYGDYPAIEKGIIYSCGMNNEKGDVLKEVLSTNRPFNQIFFFEDKRKHLESVGRMIKQNYPQCKFTGFHYKGAERTTPSREISFDEFIDYMKQLLLSVREISWL